MSVALRFFYRKLTVCGLQHIPSSGPAIIIANHPSSLMDAAIIGLLMNRPVHFFTRGDVFTGRWVTYFFSLLRMIPVYDQTAGREGLGFNDQSFSRASKILAAGGIILFFPEGNSQIQPCLKPLRKGVFRMAFMAAEKNNFSFDIPFIPAGIHYEHPVKSATDVLVQFGQPFFLSRYKTEYELNHQAAILQITRDAFDEMEKNVWHIKDPLRFPLARKCLLISLNDGRRFPTEPCEEKFNRGKWVCDAINGLSEEGNDSFQQNVNAYFTRLKELNIKDGSVVKQAGFPFYKKGFLMAGFPFIIIGYILNALPVIIGKRIADKKVYRTDFYSWVRVLCTAVLYMLWILVLFAGFLWAGWIYALGITLLAVLSGLSLFYYIRWFKEYREYRYLSTISIPALQEIRHLRTAINNIFYHPGVK